MRPIIVLAAIYLLALTSCGADVDNQTTRSASDARNLLLDAGTASDFTDGTAGWKGVNSARVARSTEESHSEAAAMLVSTQGKSEFEGAWTLPFLKVQPGGSYRASAWIRVPEEAQVGLQVIERGADGEAVDGVTEPVESTSDWVQANVEWAVGDTTKKASVQIVTINRPQRLNFFVDDVDVTSE